MPRKTGHAVTIGREVRRSLEEEKQRQAWAVFYVLRNPNTIIRPLSFQITDAVE
jgi:hypothetical protein